MTTEIRVWKSDFEQTGDPEFQVSIRKDDGTDDEVRGGYRTHFDAWQRAITLADERGLKALDEIDGDEYLPSPSE